MDAKLGTVRSRIHRRRAMLREVSRTVHRRRVAALRRPRAARPGPASVVCGGDSMIGGHLGAGTTTSTVSSSGEEDRAWDHVHACHYCRDLIEREVKTRLAGLSVGHPRFRPPQGRADGSQAGLTRINALLALSSKARRGSLVTIGGGAAGAAVLGVLALGAAPANAPAIDRRVRDQPADPGVVTPPRPERRPDGHRRAPGHLRLPGLCSAGR